MTNSYSPKYRALHWLMAILIIALLAIGLYVADLPDSVSYKGFLYDLHKSIGFIVFLLAILRVTMRIRAGNVAPIETLTPFERKGSAIVHHLLLALIVIMPTSGYLLVSSCCKPFQVFGFGNVALPISLGEKVEKILSGIHNISSKLMLLLVLAHIGAALFHHFVKKDGVLIRMLRG